MHLYAFVRGQFDKVERFIHDLTAYPGGYFPYKGYNKEGKIDKNMVMQMGVRPIQLYEFTFPEEHLDSALRILHPQNNTWIKKYDKYLKIFRKLLKLKPIPKFDHPLKHANIIRARNEVEVAALGTRKDIRDKKGVEMI